MAQGRRSPLPEAALETLETLWTAGATRQEIRDAFADRRWVEISRSGVTPRTAKRGVHRPPGAGPRRDPATTQESGQ